MKLIFFIATKGHGKGGHFHSLNTIANELGKEHEVTILNVGFQVSESLEGKYYKVSFIKYTGYNFLSTYVRLKNIVKNIQPEVIHAFDVESFAFSRLLSKSLKQPSYLNKCGGPNPKLYFPKPNVLVLFSLENQTFFDNNNRYNKVNKVLIPNRVKPVFSNFHRINKFYEKHNNDEAIKILRIARIGHHYKQSILQGVNLIEFLLNNGFNVKLIIVGTVQNVEILDQIKKYINKKELLKKVIIETSDEFTFKASEILNIGDIIIGTGRNFMEAASLNKLLLVPYKNDKFPLLVHDKNFRQVFKTNFSPRTCIEDYNILNNLKAIQNEIKQKCVNSNSLSWFNKYFNVKQAVPKYTDLYNTNSSYNKHIFDTFLNILYSIKAFVLRSKN